MTEYAPIILWVVISFVIGVFGQYLHLNALMTHIEKVRGRPTSLKWFIQNRPRKFRRMLVYPMPLGIIQFITVYPPDVDFSTVQGRAILGGYLVMQLITGAGSSKVIDKYTSDENPLTHIEDDGDDYATRMVSDEEREEITMRKDV